MTKPGNQAVADEGVPFLTVTGADINTPVNRLASLDVEVGILYAGGTWAAHRYPPREWIVRTAAVLRRTSLHVCGRVAREELAAGGIDDMTALVQRIQVNGAVGAEEIQRICELYPRHQIITQHHTGREALLGVCADNHAILVDGSAGRGILPAAWVRPETGKPVGFAGGLSSRNLAAQLPLICAAARGSWWIDMEGALRNENDWFEVGRAEACAEQFARWTAGVAASSLMPRPVAEMAEWPLRCRGVPDGGILPPSCRPSRAP